MQTWLKGLAAALISGAAAALGSMMLDPDHFGIAHLKHLGIVAGLGAVTGVINFLRQSPIPPAWNGVERRQDEHVGV